jgi:hypothetical protein
MMVKPALQAYAEKQIKNFLKGRRHGMLDVVGASEIGMCLRRIKFARQASTIVENWGAAQRGVTFENHFWVPAMRARYGRNLLYTGKQQRSLVHGQLRATPDGLLINQRRNVLQDLQVGDIGPSGVIVLDCKTIDPRINLGQPKPEHEFQAQVQMALLRITTKYRPDYALLSYVNASFYDDVVEFAIRYDGAVYDAARKRAAAVAAAISPSELLPEGWIAGGRECEYCPFKEPCHSMRGEVPVSNTANFDKGLLDQVAALAREERRWNAKAGGAGEEQRKIQHTIKELLRMHELNRVAHDGIVVVWSPVKGRIAFDMVALRDAAQRLGLDVQQFETVGQPTDRLVITESK